MFVCGIQKSHSHNNPASDDVQMKVNEHHQLNVEARQQQQQQHQLSNKSRPASDTVRAQPAMAAPAHDVGNLLDRNVHKDTLQQDRQRIVAKPADMNKPESADDLQRRNSVNQDTWRRVSNDSVPNRGDVKRADSAL